MVGHIREWPLLTVTSKAEISIYYKDRITITNYLFVITDVEYLPVHIRTCDM